MEIKMPDGSVLVSENEECIESYITNMGGVPVEKKSKKQSASKVASAKDAE